ncbi:hypothetical protein VNO77_36417 [Canavalia gladiata]|uniref:Uncharacterized protein n=1 Tax=Canavalia gladiata TaxID=3824 RepID=A0AAN9K7V4_CANGL
MIPLFAEAHLMSNRQCYDIVCCLDTSNETMDRLDPNVDISNETMDRLDPNIDDELVLSIKINQQKLGVGIRNLDLGVWQRALNHLTNLLFESSGLDFAINISTSTYSQGSCRIASRHQCTFYISCPKTLILLANNSLPLYLNERWSQRVDIILQDLQLCKYYFHYLGSVTSSPVVSKSFQTKLNLLSWLFYDTVTTHLYSRIRVSGIHPLRIHLSEDLALSCLIQAEWTLMEILLKISEVSFFSDSPEARETLLSESLHHVTLEGGQDHSCKS